MNSLAVTILFGVCTLLQALQLWMFNDLKDWIKNLNGRIERLENQQMERRPVNA